MSYTQRSGNGWLAMDINATAPDGGSVSLLVPGDWPNAVVLVDDRAAAAGLIDVMYDSITPKVQVADGSPHRNGIAGRR